MNTLSSIMSVIGIIASNMPAFQALGGDVENMLEKGKELVSSDTVATQEERDQALATIADLQADFAAGLAKLKEQAPNS